MTETQTETSCYHCGLACPDHSINIEEKYFCCNGCLSVYHLLEQNNLCNYYNVNDSPGTSPTLAEFSYLDNHEIAQKLFDFQNDSITKISFYIPTIHCSSCLYLLENLHKLNTAISQAKVDFLKKRVHITFNHNLLTIRQLVELLSQIGYKPLISAQNENPQKQYIADRKLLTQIGVAGFCAGNIMLFSFPEYIGLDDSLYKAVFGYFNIILALPVLFYSASGYFVSVFQSFKKGLLNIDFPIMLSILIAFFRGAYEVVLNDGAGYFDSLTALIFLLLVGQWFQKKTYNFLSFERDYKSYFPMAVTILKNQKEVIVPISALEKGNKIIVKNGELIPADSFLYKGVANIDYSFVTGEAAPIAQKLGDFIYAGGRQTGQKIELEVLNNVSQSYLTQLWNTDTFKKNNESKIKSFSDLVGKYFTVGVLSLAVLVASYWYFNDKTKLLNAFTAVLIIACPCTLALSYPFALGNGMRIFGKEKFYLKNGEIIEQIANCDTIVFDKTGTITATKNTNLLFVKKRDLSIFEQELLAALVSNSAHPMAQRIRESYQSKANFELDYFEETPGKGLVGSYEGVLIQLGSKNLLPSSAIEGLKNVAKNSQIHLAINHEYLGYFEVENIYRNGIENMIKRLSAQFETILLSGDNDAERTKLEPVFMVNKNLKFNFNPQNKLDFIKKLQANGKKVMMIGDGLNDAGAIKQANVGIVVTENILNFTPMSDVILAADSLIELPKYLEYSHFAIKLIKFSYGFSLMYNLVGLSFAIQGDLSPVIAAILMPLNSITLVGIASLGMVWKGGKIFKK